jgi:aspartate/methionine/tyrosine aminotransferase
MPEPHPRHRVPAHRRHLLRLPQGAGLIDRLDGVNNDLELAEYLIEQAGVALVPGSAFG